MDPMEMQKLAMLLQQMQQQQQQPQMGVPPGRFGPGQPTQGGMPVDQIPGMMPQPQAQPDTMMDILRRKMMSGGAMDMRNIAQALGPAAQAAGGMGGAMQAGQRMGMPAKAQGMPPVDQMFDMAQKAPQMMGGPGAAQAGRGLPAAAGAMAPGAAMGGQALPDDPMVELIAKLMRARGQGMQFPEQLTGSPQGILRGVR